MATDCQIDPMPCSDALPEGGLPALDETYMNDLWGGHSPWDINGYLVELAAAKCAATCHAWRQLWRWSCDNDPHGWVKDDSVTLPGIVEVDCTQEDGHVEVTGDCTRTTYGAVIAEPDMPPDESDAVTPTADVDSLCCTPPPGTKRCQWHVRFSWNGSSCRWVAGTPDLSEYTSQPVSTDICSRSGSALYLDRYGAILDAGEYSTCADAFPTPPDTLLTDALPPVYYFGCATAYSDEGLSVPAENKLIVAAVFDVGEGGSCPDWPMAAWGQKFAEDACPVEMGFPGTGYVYAGCGLEMLAGGPFCSEADISAWEAANSSACEPVVPPTPTPCQWVTTFAYNPSGCVWSVSTAPHVSTSFMHDAGDYCADMIITRYGDIHEDGICGPSSPDGFDTPPTTPVVYVVCLTTYSDAEGANLLERTMTMVGVAGDPCSATVIPFGEPDEMAFPWPLTGAQLLACPIMGVWASCSLVDGPYCDTTSAQEFINMHRDQCEDYP